MAYCNCVVYFSSCSSIFLYQCFTQVVKEFRSVYLTGFQFHKRVVKSPNSILKASSKVLAINFMSVFPLLNAPCEYSAYMSSVNAVLLAVHFNELSETFFQIDVIQPVLQINLYQVIGNYFGNLIIVRSRKAMVCLKIKRYLTIVLYHCFHVQKLLINKRIITAVIFVKIKIVLEEPF